MLLIGIALFLHAFIVLGLYFSLVRRSPQELVRRKLRQKPWLAGLAGILGFYWAPLLYSFYLRTYKPLLIFIAGLLLLFSLQSLSFVSFEGSAPILLGFALSYLSMFLSAFSVRRYAKDLSATC